MASRVHQSFLAQLVVLTILLAVAGRALGGRQIPPSAADSKNADMKQPEWFIEPDNTGSILVPGIGRIMVPPQFRPPGSSYSYGSGTGSTGGTGRNYVPGADDTFVPNPGFEVPIP